MINPEWIPWFYNSYPVYISVWLSPWGKHLLYRLDYIAMLILFTLKESDNCTFLVKSQSLDCSLKPWFVFISPNNLISHFPHTTFDSWNASVDNEYWLFPAYCLPLPHPLDIVKSLIPLSQADTTPLCFLPNCILNTKLTRGKWLKSITSSHRLTMS